MPLLAKVALETYRADVCPGDSASGLCLRYLLETPEGEVLSFDKRLELDAILAKNRWAMTMGEVDRAKVKPRILPFEHYCIDGCGEVIEQQGARMLVRRWKIVLRNGNTVGRLFKSEAAAQEWLDAR